MNESLKRIQDGLFADEFIEDSKNGQKKPLANREAENASQIEEVARCFALFSAGSRDKFDPTSIFQNEPSCKTHFYYMQVCHLLKKLALLNLS